MDPWEILMGFLRGGGNMPLSPYIGSPGHSTNYFTYTPGWGEALSKMLFPGIKQTGPPLFVQSDWEQILLRSEQERRIQSQAYQSSPMAEASLRMFLQTTGIANAKDANSIARKASQFDIFGFKPFPQLWNMFVSPGIQGEKAQAQIDLSRFFSGYTFGTGINQRTGLGFNQIENLTQGLMKSTYRDDLGLFRKNEFLNMKDMSDIMRLSVDYGGQAVNEDQLLRQTEGLAKVIQLGIGVYHTLDKEQVVQNIMELTRGQVPISDTVQLQNIVSKVHSLAKNANISIDYMQKIAAEGSALFEQMGISPTLGAITNANLMMFTQTMAQGNLIPADQLARMGGRTGLKNIYLGQYADTLGSSSYQYYGLMYNTAASQQEKINIKERFLRGDLLNAGDIGGLNERIMNELTERELRINPQLSREQAKINANRILDSEKQRRATLGRDELTRDTLGIEGIYGATLSKVREILRPSGQEKLLENKRAFISGTDEYNLLANLLFPQYQDYNKVYADIAMLNPDNLATLKRKQYEANLEQANTIALEGSRRTGSVMDIFKRRIADPNDKDLKLTESFMAALTQGQLFTDPTIDQMKVLFDQATLSSLPEAMKSHYLNWNATREQSILYNQLRSLTGIEQFSNRKQVFGQNGIYTNMVSNALSGDFLSELLGTNSGRSPTKAKMDEIKSKFFSSSQKLSDLGLLIQGVTGGDLSTILSDPKTAATWKSLLSSPDNKIGQGLLEQLKNLNKLTEDIKENTGLNVTTADDFREIFKGNKALLEKLLADWEKAGPEGAMAMFGQREISEKINTLRSVAYKEKMKDIDKVRKAYEIANVDFKSENKSALYHEILTQIGNNPDVYRSDYEDIISKIEKENNFRNTKAAIDSFDKSPEEAMRLLHGSAWDRGLTTDAKVDKITKSGSALRQIAIYKKMKDLYYGNNSESELRAMLNEIDPNTPSGKKLLKTLNKSFDNTKKNLNEYQKEVVKTGTLDEYFKINELLASIEKLVTVISPMVKKISTERP